MKSPSMREMGSLETILHVLFLCNKVSKRIFLISSYFASFLKPTKLQQTFFLVFNNLILMFLTLIMLLAARVI